MKGIEVIIMCGGKGTRLARKLPPNTPKCMAEVGGQPFLEMLLRQVEKEMTSSLDWITLATGHRGEVVEQYIFQRKNNKRVRCVRDKQMHGTAACAWNMIAASTRNTVVVINGDTWSTQSISEIVDYHREGWITPLTVAATTAYVPRGVFVFNQQRIGHWKKLFQHRDLNYDFARLIEKNVGPIKFFFSNVPFCDIGTPDELEKFSREVTALRSLPERHTASVSSVAAPTTRRTT